MFKTEIIKKVNIYDDKRLIAYYITKDNKVFQIYLKGILIDKFVGTANDSSKALKIIEFLYKKERNKCGEGDINNETHN